MKENLTTGIAAFALVVGSAFAAESPERAGQSEPLIELETVLVVGEQPGPGLWKVRQGDHVMWVLASYAPLPRGMTWRSKEVEARIAESREVLYPGDVRMDLDVGVVKMLSHIPSIIKAFTIPDGKTLKDVLPPATYQKWHPLREKYARRSIERLRPALAIEELREAAYRKNDLRDGPVVDAVVKAAEKKHKVRIRKLRDAQRTVRVPDLKGLLKTMAQVELPDIECFTLSLDRVESDLEQMKVLANAWARGHIDAMRSLEHQPEFGGECENVLEIATTQGDSAGAELVRKIDADWKWHEEQAAVQVKREWLVAARGALERNRSTFAVLPVREVVSSTGYLEELRKLGYEVEQP